MNLLIFFFFFFVQLLPLRANTPWRSALCSRYKGLMNTNTSSTLSTINQRNIEVRLIFTDKIIRRAWCKTLRRRCSAGVRP